MPGYFSDDSPERDPSGNQNRQLHLCPDCRGDLVQPVRWEQAGFRNGSSLWRVKLRCPECEHDETGVFTNIQVEAFDEVLDEGKATLERELTDMVKEDLRQAADTFAIALQQDLINADDFRPRGMY